MTDVRSEITPRRRRRARAILEGEEIHRKKRRHSRVQCLKYFHEALAEIKKTRSEKMAKWNANLVSAEDISGEEELVFGPYKMSPACGMVSPGSTAIVNLEFTAEYTKLSE